MDQTNLVAGCRQKPARSEKQAPEGVAVETVLGFGAVGDVQAGAVLTYPAERVAASRISRP
jgi:hypothetical protein